jgi:hypothetical protein
LATPFSNVKGLARGFFCVGFVTPRSFIALHNLIIGKDREFFPFQEKWHAAAQHGS